jgi:hypothetical protein
MKFRLAIVTILTSELVRIIVKLQIVAFLALTPCCGLVIRHLVCRQHSSQHGIPFFYHDSLLPVKSYQKLLPKQFRGAITSEEKFALPEN